MQTQLHKAVNSKGEGTALGFPPLGGGGAVGNFATPYTFNAKEQDPEPSAASSRTPLKNNLSSEQTGNYYYGARYGIYPESLRFGNPQTSIWFGVDALAHKYPSYNPYAYCFNNPVVFIDPDGREPITGAIISMLLEVATQVGDYMYTNGWGKKEFKAGLASIDKSDVMMEGLKGFAIGFLDPSGVGKVATWAAKKQNRKILSKLFEEAVEITIDALTEIGKSVLNDKEFDAGQEIANSFINNGLESLLPDTKYFKKYLQKNENNLNRYNKRLNRIEKKQSKRYTEARGAEIGLLREKIGRAKLKQDILEAGQETLEQAKARGSGILLKTVPVSDTQLQMN